MGKLIVHISQLDLSTETGMGRVESHWKRELMMRGYEFLHIGRKEVGSLIHDILFPSAAYRLFEKIGRQPDLVIAHEPASACFAANGFPLAVESHGLERRGWNIQRTAWATSVKTRITYPLFRLPGLDKGIRNADLLLVPNMEDLNFAIDFYGRDLKDTFVFRNGVYRTTIDETIQPNIETILYLGNWIQRKGVRFLVEAAEILDKRGFRYKWLLAGVGNESDKVLSSWPTQLRSQVEVVRNFTQEAELQLLSRASVFVLPSLFEGQPLSLLQAMECGRCCISTNICGQKDIIKHAENGFLYDQSDVESLALLIQQCMESKSDRLRIGRNARHSMLNREWEVVSAEVADRLEVLIRK